MTAPELGRRSSADDLIAGVLDLAIATPLALGALVDVSAVEWSDEIRTACVEAAHRPRLLLNPDFVAEHCTTRERLAMLLLHELSHISLGHTRLYPRPDAVHNVAFDAVINARLVHALRDRGIDPGPYAALLESCYDPDDAPFFLLRPPPGWPRGADWATSAGAPEALRSVHRRLYEPGSVDGVTYTEIVRALRSWADEAPGGGIKGNGADPQELSDRLLGAHGRTAREKSALTGGRDGNAAGLLARTLSQLGVDDTGKGWGGRGQESLVTIDAHRADRRLEQSLARLLRSVFTDTGNAARRRTTATKQILSVDRSRDRRAAGRDRLASRFGAPKPLLFASSIEERRPERQAALVYLDVSGSMGTVLPRLRAALRSLHRLLAADIFAFSGDVVQEPTARLLAGSVHTTWGTDIAPMLRHATRLAMQSPSLPRRALVLTDGYFADPDPSTARGLEESGLELHFAIAGPGPLPEGSWVASATRLPDPTHTNQQRRTGP